LLVRSELAEAAVKLPADQGFEETTVDQIVAAVGMSRRTFSRCLDSKEDVIVHTLAEAGVKLCAETNARPADEPPTVALRRALPVFTSMSVGNPAKTLRVSRPILDTLALLVRFLERQSQWQAGTTGILALRAGLAPDRPASCRRCWCRPDGLPSRPAPLGGQRRQRKPGRGRRSGSCPGWTGDRTWSRCGLTDSELHIGPSQGDWSPRGKPGCGLDPVRPARLENVGMPRSMVR
jgi:AcrR family transcriptional regulator